MWCAHHNVLQGVQSAIAKNYPALASQIMTLNDTFASDVEEEANSYFQVGRGGGRV